jgi:DNA-binding NtrC family response regulator
MATILVVDDEIGIRELLSEILGDEGHSVVLAENAQQARLAREAEAPNLVLLDIWMPDTDGVTLLKEWAAKGLLTMPVIMMSGHATIDTAVEATRIGALDFLEKPIALQKLLQSVQNGLARGKLAQSARFVATAAGQAAHAGHGQISTLHLLTHEPERSPLEAALEELARIELDTPLRDARDAFERIYFEYHLNLENGSMTRLAERTGIERTHLYRKLKQLGVEVGRSARRHAS